MSLKRLREQADDLGMTPAEAGRYIEQEAEAREVAAELAEQRALMAEWEAER